MRQEISHGSEVSRNQPRVLLAQDARSAQVRDDLFVTPPPRPTLAHVAKRAHVSVTTASAALRGATGVSEQTRQRVVAVATAIGYRADSQGAALRSGRGGMVGMILESAALEEDPDSPKLFWPRFLNGFTQALTVHGFGVAIVSRIDDRPLMSIPMKALVIHSALSEELQRALPFGLPVVSGGAALPGVVASVNHDYQAIAAECVAHLTAQGATKIGFLVGPDDPAVSHLLRAQFGEAAASAGLDFVVAPSVSEVIARVADSRVDAVVTVGHGVPRLLSQLVKAGVDVPGDVLLLSLSEGDVERNLHPQVSSLSFLGRESGQAVGEMVVRGLAEGEFISLVMPHRFDQRESTTRQA